jgi:hypothetical protein
MMEIVYFQTYMDQREQMDSSEVNKLVSRKPSLTKIIDFLRLKILVFCYRFAPKNKQLKCMDTEVQVNLNIMA